jgi:hypothetical protein
MEIGMASNLTPFEEFECARWRKDSAKGRRFVSYWDQPAAQQLRVPVEYIVAPEPYEPLDAPPDEELQRVQEAEGKHEP